METYDAYLRNDCYGFVIQCEGEEVSSCWGYFGPEGESWAMETALAETQVLVKAQQVTLFETLKTWIKSKVPLWKRLELKQDLPALS